MGWCGAWCVYVNWYVGNEDNDVDKEDKRLEYNKENSNNKVKQGHQSKGVKGEQGW